MKVRVQLVENNPLHKVPTVFVNIHRTQFMFNVIPTLLRHRKKHKINLYNSSSIFFTKNSVEAMGGLPNLLLFRSGAEHSNTIITNKIYLFGDNSLIRYFQKLRFKLGYKILRVSYTDWQKKLYRFGIFSVNLFNKIKQSPNLFQMFTKLQKYLQQNADYKDYYDSRFYIKNTKTKYIDIDCNYYHTNLLDIYPLINNKGYTTLTSYIIVLAEQRKGLDVNLQKFVAESNVKKQKDITEFCRVGTITIQNKIYKKEDYLFKENFKPTNIMVLHHQSEDSILELLKNQIWQNYFKNANKTGLVVHIVQNAQLFQSSALKKLVETFQPTTKHLWFNHKMHSISQSEEVILEENLLFNSVWSQLFPNQIPNVKSQRFKYYNMSVSKKIQEIFPSLSHYLYKRAYNFIKNEYLGDSYAQRLQTQPKQARLVLIKQALKKKSKQLASLSLPQNHAASDVFEPKVVFLGTSSSMPTIDRNTSGILVSLFKNSSLLFDCGEQSFQQIVNHFSPERLQQQLLKIRVIFITHIHSDHNLGILNLISERRKLMKKHKIQNKVFLMIPFNVFNWYQSYNLTVQDLSDSCEVVFTQLYLNESLQASQTNQNKSFSCSGTDLDNIFEAQLEVSTKNKQLVQTYLKQKSNHVSQFQNFLQQHGYTQFLPLRVIHCPQSFGVTVSSAQFKVSYSGDTRPSLDFQQMAKNSDIMIHQATFNDEQAKLAENYRHSTVQQAVNIGLQSKSKVLVLTHFNQDFKYPNKIKNQRKMNYFNQNTILAFDHLQVKCNHQHNLCGISKKILQISKEVQQKLKHSKLPKNSQYEKQTE